MASQRFCLRWNNHQSNMLSVFDQLLHAETFTDVTLAVDGQLLKAHKMVLSACSPYFQALFVNHQEKHPIVILKDVPYADMKSLLDFMYRGEVSVDQERLTAFLKVAESLRIKGLTEVNEEKCDLPSLTNSLIQQQQSAAHTPPPQLHRIHPYMNQKRPASGMPTGGAPPNLLMPLLGNALMQPKRKRGRPRKLSGSSSDALNTAASPPGEYASETAHAQSNRSSDQLVRGSPEMLEVKMSMDNFNTEDGGTSGGEDGGEALLIDEGDDVHSSEAPTHKDSEATELQQYLTYGEGTEANGVPYITLEVLSSDGSKELRKLLIAQDNETQETKLEQAQEKADNVIANAIKETAEPKSKANPIEYLVRNDGRIVCKLCGEVLRNRTLWYRHKYRRHVSQIWQPLPLFQCKKCYAYFKSRKGYVGHVSSMHSDLLIPLYRAAKEKSKEEATIKSEIVGANEKLIDPELAIPKSEVLNHNVQARVSLMSGNYDSKMIRNSSKGNLPECLTDAEKKELEAQRSRDEKMVSDIIDRVRRECEAQEGVAGPARRGYSRKTTIMNT